MYRFKLSYFIEKLLDKREIENEYLAMMMQNPLKIQKQIAIFSLIGLIHEIIVDSNIMRTLKVQYKIKKRKLLKLYYNLIELN